MNQLNSKKRILMGPGPSDVDPRILEALSQPTIGHLDPLFLEIMNDIRGLLQKTFQTHNEMTLAISGTGSAGMETCVANLIEPGESMLVCNNGVFGARMADVASRYGARVDELKTDWGGVFDPDQVKNQLKRQNYKVVGIVQAETSTGAHQPIAEISNIVHEHDALLIVDAVTSLAGTEVNVDGWEIDACYSGTQKCLSCPPGMAPVTFGPRAIAALDKRKSKVHSWYLDLTMIRNYWGSERVYHHTAPVNMAYALQMALTLVLEEGLPRRWKRHLDNHKILKAGLEAIGIRYIPKEGYQLPMLNAISVPEEIDESRIRKQLLEEFNIEVGGGLGKFKGRALRIGLMGYASSRTNIFIFLAGFEKCLLDQGFNLKAGMATAASLLKAQEIDAENK